MRFEFATSDEIVFGPGAFRSAVPRMACLGRKALVITGKNPHRYATCLEQLEREGFFLHLVSVQEEPTVDGVEAALEQSRKESCELVIGMGGGSALDTGKAVAALLTNPGPLADYLEIVGKGLPLQNDPAPCIAVPTTAGTGAEVTRNAVIASPAHRVKVSMRSPRMLPRLAIVDPELTLTLPPEVTAATGMDALTQLIETYVSRKANPITDALCREGLACCARSLLRACEEGSDLGARSDMSLASLLSGLALANGGLGAVHGIAGPLGGWIDIPHGVACGRLLPPVFAANVRRVQSESPSHPALPRFEEIARILTGEPHAALEEGLTWLDRLVRRLDIPPLNRFGLQEPDLPEIAANALKASSMKGNPVELSERDIVDILRRA
ncbi:MAG: iron-containing alcohol dehydrogenase [Desulfobacteraceae bacterium]